MTSPTNPLRPDQIDPLRGIQPSQEAEEGSGGNFAEMMGQSMSKTTQSSAPSPMNVLAGTNPVSGPSYDTMQSQLGMAQSNLANMQTQMQMQGLKIRPQDRDLLTNQMMNANDNLSVVNAKLGLPQPQVPSPVTGPLGKFLGLINSGSQQILDAKQQLSSYAQTPDKLNPAEMLLVQVKINQAQQQIEFSSILLSKVVDDFKQLMNIQI